jgi:hypothetical protein
MGHISEQDIRQHEIMGTGSDEFGSALAEIQF